MSYLKGNTSDFGLQKYTFDAFNQILALGRFQNKPHLFSDCKHKFEHQDSLCAYHQSLSKLEEFKANSRDRDWIWHSGRFDFGILQT